MNNEKVYVIFNGRRDGSWGTTNEIEEEIWKVAVSTKEKIIELIFKTSGVLPDEYGYSKFNLEEHPHNGHEDTDYDYYRYEEHDLERF